MNRANYSILLRDTRWQKCRLEVFQRDQWSCRQCGNSTEELHVHHIFYTAYYPWDEPRNNLVTLCKACHDDIHKDKTRIPEISNFFKDFKEGDLIEPRQTIKGVLHRGHKLIIGGGSKSNKTWCLMDLALSVVSGSNWIGMECDQGNVLYLNLELDSYHFAKRSFLLSKSKGIVNGAWHGNGPISEFHVWNLRGHSSSYESMIPLIKERIKGRDYALIVIDPLYKLLGEANENSATDMANLMNAIEEVALISGASIVMAAHYSKGNQAEKDSMDRMSGSGVFARDPDAIIALTKHQEDNAFTVEMTLRNFPAIDPFAVRWVFPRLIKDDDLDPYKLKPIYSQSAASRLKRRQQFLKRNGQV